MSGAITLHSAVEQVRSMLDQFDPETGELTPEFAAARELVKHKAVGVVAYMLETTKHAEAIEAYAKELQQRAKTMRARHDWLHRYLAEHMLACGVTEISDERGIFSAKLERERDKAVDVFDMAQLPAEYVRETVKREPDKAALKRAIASGAEVPGARIVARDRLTVK
jgi:hypothetical protein